MSYRIDYALSSKPPARSHSFRPWGLTLCAFLLFCLLVHAFWQPGADLLATLLLGEGYAEILSALEQTAEASRQGIPLREAAVGAFREMLHGG